MVTAMARAKPAVTQLRKVVSISERLGLSTHSPALCTIADDTVAGAGSERHQ
jgi:hypothetical protein